MDADDAAADQSASTLGASTEAPRPFRIGSVPGVVVSKWTRTWAERFPDRPFEVIRTEQADQSEALRSGRLDACFARFPLDRDGLSAIPLYTEAAVVLLSAEHPLAQEPEVSVIDLVDDDLLQDPDAVPQWRDAAAELRTAEDSPAQAWASTADAVALVAAGLGVLILPMSVARTYRRRDVTAVPVSDVDGTDIALTWPTERTSDDVERLIGIVRGRTVNSTRGPAPAPGGQGAAAPGSGKKTAARSSGSTAAQQPRRARGRGATKPRRRNAR